MPVEALGQTLAFRWLKRAGEAIAPDVEGEMAEGAGDGGSNQDSNDGDGDGTTSGGSIDLNRVNAMLLAAESQHTHQTRRT